MKFRRIFAWIRSALLAAVSLAACGSRDEGSSDRSESGRTTVKLGVVGSIYEELWNPA